MRKESFKNYMILLKRFAML